MSTPTRAEWALFSAVFGPESIAQARKTYAHRRRAMRVRLTLALLALLISASMAVGGLYGFLLLMIAAYDIAAGL